MISMITSFLSKLRKGFARLGEAGYTLTEMTAVVAVSGALTAVILPVAVSKVSDGNFASGAGDVRTIGSAISDFLKDTGDYPMRSSSGITFDARFAKTLLLSTDKDMKSYRSPDITVLVTASVSDVGGVGTLVADIFTPHFFSNAPCGGTLTVGASEVTGPISACAAATSVTALYSTVGDRQWKKAYLSKPGLDPWGRSYIIYLYGIREAAHTNNSAGSSAKRLLVLSAGPNGIIQTTPADDSVRGDDLGVVVGGSKS